MESFLLIVKPKLPAPWDRALCVDGWECGIRARVRIKTLKVYALWCFPPK